MRFCFRIRLRPGTEGEYDRRHEAVWPDVRTVIAECGIRNYTGLRMGLDVIYVGEADDAEAAVGRMADHPVTRRWAAFLSDVVEAGARGPDGRLLLGREVFHEPGRS